MYDLEEAKRFMRERGPKVNKNATRDARIAAAKVLLRDIASLDGIGGFVVQLDEAKNFLLIRVPQAFGAATIVGVIMYDDGNLEFRTAQTPGGPSEDIDLPFEVDHFYTTVPDTFYNPVQGEPRVRYTSPAAYLVTKALAAYKR